LLTGTKLEPLGNHHHEDLTKDIHCVWWVSVAGTLEDIDSMPCLLISSSGLGKATVEMLLKEGAFASILDVNESKEAWTKPSSVKFIKTDIRETKDIEKAISETVEWASKMHAPLGGVINCAGVGTAAKANLDILIRMVVIN
jgi:NADP-dependent 3-hydroxy acid dehydrogenase YdfG